MSGAAGTQSVGVPAKSTVCAIADGIAAAAVSTIGLKRIVPAHPLAESMTSA